MATIKISQLPPPPNGTGSGTPQGTDLVPATDTTDTTSAASGTTKKYTQSSILNFYLEAQGLTTYAAVRVGTTTALTVTYSNGASGVGATLTNAGTQAALAIDGVTLSVGDRVLVKNQAAQLQNGIYTVTSVGSGSTNWVMTRATDYDQTADIVQYGVVLVNQGTVNAGLLYQETAAAPITIGTDAITFVAYSASYASGSVASITGTANQVLANGTSAVAQTGAVTLTLPQNIATSSTPTFAGANLGNITISSNSIISSNTNGAINLAPNGTGAVAVSAGVQAGLTYTNSVVNQAFDLINTQATNSRPQIRFYGNTSTQLGYVQCGLTDNSSTGGLNIFVAASQASGKVGIRDSVGTAALFTSTLAAFTANVQAGSNTIAGGYTSYPAGSLLGTLAFTAANSAGNYANVLTNASTSAARTWTLPDATGTIALTSSPSAGYVLTAPSGTQTITGYDLVINTVNVGLGGTLVATNLSVGVSALAANTSGVHNHAIGYQAMQAMQSGNNNTAVGYLAMNANVNGTGNVAVGRLALQAGVTGSNNVAIGSGSMNSASNVASQNNAIGTSAFAAITTGNSNTGMGDNVATLLTTGSNNVVIGRTAGGILVGGSDNTLLGYGATADSASCAGAIAIGEAATTTIATGATSGDVGPGIAIGSASFPVGFRGDGTIFTGGTGRGYWQPKINGTAYLVPCFISGTLTAGAAMVTDANGSPILSSAMTNGQIIIGSTGATPAAATLTAGTGISISNAAGSITINSSGGGLATATISGTTQSATVNTTYIALNSGQTTLSLPSTYAVGDIIRLVGSTANTGGWVVQANTGDTVRVNNATTSAGGTVTCTAVAGQCIELVCDVANTSWVMTNTSSVLLTTA